MKTELNCPSSLRRPEPCLRYWPSLLALLLAVLCLALGSSHALAQVIIYQDDFNDQQNVNTGGPYTQTLYTTVPTVRNAIGGGSASATWQAGVESGGWGQRDYNNNGVATPTSSNFLPFTPQTGHNYTVQATIDTTALGGADPGGTSSWFALGFTSSQHNWNGADGATIDTANLVRFNSNTNITITYTVSGATLVAAGVQYVGWITDSAGTVNLNASQQVTIENFSLTIQDENPCTNTYAANGADSGTAPVDGSSPYLSNSVVTVLGNTGALAKTGFNFGGWNTAADGSGTTYSGGASFTITSNTTLYARWVSGYTVTYTGNGNTGGSVPVDTNSYSSGASATVLGSNTLVRTGYVFTNWNKAADGSGASYNSGSTLTVNSNTTLYAQWALGQFTATYLAGVGGTISGTATQTVTYGTGTTPVTAVPNVSGYRFVSWNDGVLTATRSDINFSSNLTVVALFDNNLTWDNGGGTFAWNTTDTNWTGSVWNNSIPDNAVFNNGTNTVNLTQAITGGSLTANFGGAPSGTHNLVLAGNSLSLGSILVWGGYNPAAGGGGVDTISQANNQRLTLSNSTVNVSGNVALRRGSFMAQGSTVLNMGGVTAPDAWSVFLMQDSAVVTATNGIDLSTLACEAHLNGGTLNTPFIKVQDAAFNGTGGLFLDGGVTLVPTGASSEFIVVTNSGNNLPVHPATIGSGGVVVNTAYAVTIANPFNGSGGLTKKGAGTLTLDAPFAGPLYGFIYPGNTYAGRTVVQAGVLSIASLYALPTGGVVDITNGAAMDLNYAGNIRIGALTLNGVAQPYGTYGATGSGATYTNDTYFTSGGVLEVVGGQVLTWTGATDNNWDETTANWTNNASVTQWFNAAGVPDSAIFDATGLGQSNVNVVLNTTFYASNVTFNAAGYTIGTNALTLGNTPNFIVNADATISSALQGGGGLTKSGNGTLTLSARYNNYTGGTTVNAGLLDLAADAWTLSSDGGGGGGAATVGSGATLRANNSIANKLNGLTLNSGTVDAVGGGNNADWGNFFLTGNVSASGNSSLNAESALRAASVTFDVASGGTLNVGGVLHNGYLFASTSGGGGNPANVIKSGAGTMMLNGTNLYTGATTVSVGTLAGSGSIAGPVTVQAGATLAAGAALNGVGTLTLGGNLTLNGNVLVNLDKSLAQSNSVFAVSGALTNANGAATTLTVSNLGPALVVGDTFTVFSQACSNGAAATIIAPAGYAFANNLEVDGSITVSAVPNTAAPTLSVVRSGSNLTFTWTGSGSLESQTNLLSKGLSTNWVAYPNGTNGVTVPIDATKGAVFFRVKQ